MAKSGLVFFDTNVLVYQFDRTDKAKQRVAEQLIDQHFEADDSVISTQVVQEFMNVAIKKFDSQIPEKELELAMDDLLSPLCKHFPTIDYYYRALNLFRAQSLSFYDALIVQAALDLGCDTLYSEDLQAGQKFGKLTVVNPFAD